MTDIGFRAFDPHELLCHFLAVEKGYYADAGLDPRLHDLTFTPAVPSDLIHVACGSALLDRLRGGRLRVVLAAARGPVFRLVSPSAPSLSALVGARVASFPFGSPPDVFLRIVFRQAGVDPAEDLTLLPIRDDAARIGLLASGDAEAALVSSATPYSVSGGYHEVANLAEHLSIPTSGLAVHEDLLNAQPVLVAALVEIHRKALEVIGGDAGTVGAVLADRFHIPAGEVATTTSMLQAVFRRDGRITRAEAEEAIRLTSSELGVEPVAWDDFYS